MPDLEQLKQQIREQAADSPGKFFPTEVLREKDFERSKCSECGNYFWSYLAERSVCGEPECSGGYTFIGNSPTREEYSYVEAWEKYRDFMSDRGYEPINRYPVVARWRDDTEFVEGSIYCFQPYVVSGEAEPPAPELVIPQPSLRFNDVDNVGITGRHYVLHDHIGQTCFKDASDYDQDRYFRDMFEFAVEELGIPEEELVLHEDAWGGGGNLGASMEFFVSGLELWNQVYMTYRVTEEGYEPLDLKVLDMGMGHERITWIAHGTETSYECVMPEVLEKMKSRTGLEIDEDLWQEFLPHSGRLNVDEVDDIDRVWREIADDMDVDVDRLRQEVEPVAALYSVAEHTRALLFALADGKLPSNAGGGHNLRMVYRRARDFIEKYGWELSIPEIAEWHAEELEPLFPELRESVDEVREILEVEERKYREARKRAEEKLEEFQHGITEEEMVELYESHGVSPEMLEEHGFDVPDDFYARLASEGEEEARVEQKFDLEGVPDTELLYYRNEARRTCEADVVAVRDDWVALDRTVFYPEGGGQEPDHGTVSGTRVDDVQKQSGVVLHHMPGHGLEEGDHVEAEIDWSRRLQLMQHHTATHIVNGAARKELGDHIWQAGAHKTEEYARLDVTHYEKLDRETLDSIEARVNDIIHRDLEVEKLRMEKTEAESEYGFRIYQGGAPPGNEVRIVKIGDVDVEACGGTHLSSTGEADRFLVTGSTKVQDGAIRLEYRAGKAAEEYLSRVEERVSSVAEKLDAGVPGGESEMREVQRELCTVFSVEPGHLEDTVERFLDENRQFKQRAEKLADYMDREVEFQEVEGDGLVERAESLYSVRKENEKVLEDLEEELDSFLGEKMEGAVLEEEVPTPNIGLLIQVARKLAADKEGTVTLLGEEGGVSASEDPGIDASGELEKHFSQVEGDGSFAKAFE